MMAVTREGDEVPFRRSRRWKRLIRKHRHALLVLGAYLAVFLFPSFFMGRVISPNDIYDHYEPWVSDRLFIAQSPIIHDPPMAYYPVAAMLQRAPSSFHWNPWLASGIPGWGSAASAMTPFALVPALMPLALFFQAMILMKLLFAFWCAYMWLREERMGKLAASAGAMIVAASGPAFALWLWQSTNATALYPALLWAIARMSRGKKNSIIALALLGICFIMSGYPASVLLGLWLSVFYAVAHMIRTRTVPVREIVRAILAMAMAVAITAPLLEPFVEFLQRTGYLEWRRDLSEISFAPEHLVGLVDAEYLGSLIAGRWIGDSRLGPINNQIEATIWFGPLTIVLVVLGLFERKRRWLVFSWMLLGAVVLLVMTGIVEARWILDLPGLRYSPATRLRILLPVAFGFLAAAGVRTVVRVLRITARRKTLRIAALALVALLGYLHGRASATFYPYLPIDEATVESKPSIEFLTPTNTPFRVAPTFFWMMPNSSQIFGVEDIRSQWSSESAYREIIRRIDPKSGSGNTVLLLNALTMNIEDPFLPLLNVRYIVEPPAIDILQWRVGEKLEPKPVPDREVVLVDRASIRTWIRLLDGTRTIEVTGWPRESEKATGRLTAEIYHPATGELVATRSVPVRELKRRPKVFVPVGDARPGEAVEVRLRAEGGDFVIPHLQGDPFLRQSASGLSLVHEGENARIYELVDTLPRYRATWSLVERDPQEVLADRDLRFDHETIVAAGLDELGERLAGVPPEQRRVRFELLRYDPSDRIVRVTSEVPFLFTTSEKLVPELAIYVDGEPAEMIPINGIFAGVPVEPGTHTITLEWRIGRSWWPWSVVGIILFGILGVADRRW